MKQIILIAITIFFAIFSNAQEVCLKIDSINVYRIPWSVSSRVNISTYQLIRGEDDFLSKNVIKNQTALQYLTETDFLDYTKKIGSYESWLDMDVRSVILIYYSNGLMDTVAFKRSTAYYNNKNIYS